jgi:hypothetical protein
MTLVRTNLDPELFVLFQPHRLEGPAKLRQPFMSSSDQMTEAQTRELLKKENTSDRDIDALLKTARAGDLQPV